MLSSCFCVLRGRVKLFFCIKGDAESLSAEAGIRVLEIPTLPGLGFVFTLGKYDNYDNNDY